MWYSVTLFYSHCFAVILTCLLQYLLSDFHTMHRLCHDSFYIKPEDWAQVTQTEFPHLWCQQLDARKEHLEQKLHLRQSWQISKSDWWNGKYSKGHSDFHHVLVWQLLQNHYISRFPGQGSSKFSTKESLLLSLLEEKKEVKFKVSQFLNIYYYRYI